MNPLAGGASTPAAILRGCNPAVRSSLLAALFAPGVCTAELRTPGDPALLFAEELRHVSAAMPKRVQEFAAGRQCARRALSELGCIEAPLEVARDRQPRWPTGTVGSITHTEGFCGAVAAGSGRLRALGVDAEIVGRVTRALWPEILSPQEAVWLETLPHDVQLRVATLIFSAKEAFFKCQFAVTGAWLDFADATIRCSTRGEGVGSFSIRPRKKIAALDGIAMPMTGQFRFAENLVLSGIALPV